MDDARNQLLHLFTEAILLCYLDGRACCFFLSASIVSSLFSLGFYTITMVKKFWYSPFFHISSMSMIVLTRDLDVALRLVAGTVWWISALKRDSKLKSIENGAFDWTLTYLNSKDVSEPQTDYSAQGVTYMGIASMSSDKCVQWTLYVFGRGITWEVGKRQPLVQGMSIMVTLWWALFVGFLSTLFVWIRCQRLLHVVDGFLMRLGPWWCGLLTGNYLSGVHSLLLISLKLWVHVLFLYG